jgi:hypothetical protein
LNVFDVAWSSAAFSAETLHAVDDIIMHGDDPLKSASSDRTHVFFGIPVLGFFRQKRRVQFETRPLFTDESSHSYQATTELRSAPTISSTCTLPGRTGKELWSILRSHVRNESFQINDLRSKSERVRTKEERHFEDINLPYEFSVLECFFALVVYLGISILAFSFVYEHWSPIEAMYFACVSFTTIGESCWQLELFSTTAA